jgi:prefoldin subunit 5
MAAAAPPPAAGAEISTTNPRGIPSFPFMNAVSDYCNTLADVEPTLQRFTEMINKYTFMQQNVEKRAQGLREKLPEIRNTLDVVRFLRRRREGSQNGKVGVEGLEIEDGDEEEDVKTGKDSDSIETTFPLSDTLYARAKITPSKLDSVYLWLGANVMVSYPLAEAEELLREKLAKAKDSLGAAEEDLEFLRVQITTLEVATARVYNWDVGEKRRLREKGELEGREREEVVSIRDGKD